MRQLGLFAWWQLAVRNGVCLFVCVMAAVLTSHVDRLYSSEKRDASGSNGNERIDQTNLFRNEHPRELSAERSNRTQPNREDESRISPCKYKKNTVFKHRTF